MDRPPVFADEAFAAALEATHSSDRWLIVDATASWCGPCKSMDQTTWRDTEVVAWLETYATALQIDVDGEQEWARTHEISAMPTLIAFKQGTEFDRIVGGRKPRELLDWLEGLQQGQTAVERLRSPLGEGKSDVDRRFELARRFSLPGSSTKLPANLRGYGSTWPNSTRRWQAFAFHSWPVTLKPWSPRAN